MKITPGWPTAIVQCLRERQVWREISRELLYLLMQSSNGLGTTLASAALGIGHNLVQAAAAKRLHARLPVAVVA